MAASLKGPNLGDIIRSKLPNYKQNFLLEIGYYEGATYPDGTSVVEVAIVNEFGAVIDHPGGTKYIKDAVIARKVNGEEIYHVGVRFVSEHFVGETHITGPHQIVIPARPFFRTALANNLEKWKKDFAFVFKKTGYDVEKSLSGLGVVVKRDIQQQIDNTYEPPNAPSTIRAKKGTTHPLIGLYKLLYNSIAWQVIDVSS